MTVISPGSYLVVFKFSLLDIFNLCTWVFLIGRFNASDFLERLRGKRLMLVGDSMNRNQFESLLCLLREGLVNKSRMFETRGRRITKGRGQYVFKFQVHLEVFVFSCGFVYVDQI